MPKSASSSSCQERCCYATFLRKRNRAAAAEHAHAADRFAREIVGFSTACAVRLRRLMGRPFGGSPSYQALFGSGSTHILDRRMVSLSFRIDRLLTGAHL